MRQPVLEINVARVSVQESRDAIIQDVNLWYKEYYQTHQEEIVEQFKDMIWYFINKSKIYFYTTELSEEDSYSEEDIYQDCMLEVIKAIRDFDPSKNTSLSTLAGFYAKRKISNIIKGQRKSRIHRIDLAAAVKQDGETSADIQEIQGLIDNTRYTEVSELMIDVDSLLSNEERKILNHRLEGRTTREIRDAMGYHSAGRVTRAIKKIRQVAQKLERI